MILPVDPDAARPCTSCGHPRLDHSFGGACTADPCTCLEFRQAPDDTVLASVVRCLRLDAASEQAQTWIEQLRMVHIPLYVPAERWYVDIARCLVSHGVELAHG